MSSSCCFLNRAGWLSYVVFVVLTNKAEKEETLEEFLDIPKLGFNGPSPFRASNNNHFSTRADGGYASLMYS